MSAITIDTRLIGGMFRDYTPKLKLEFRKSKKLSDNDFFDFCQDNPDVRIEMDKNGEIEIMPPTGSETGSKNFNLIAEFAIWTKKDGTGKGFDSSTGFVLPNGAIRSPDLSWIKLERWNSLTADQREKFAHVCPDFVVELRSESDSLKKLQAKMIEYIENGTSLGWLIDVKSKKVYVYQPNTQVQILEKPLEVSGEPCLQSFVLQMKEIWG
jgi:Uma2 family endonuclease